MTSPAAIRERHRPAIQLPAFVIWAVPVALLFAIWWDGLRTWFIADDFAWLGLLRTVHDWPSFLDSMFSPMAQGTIRPWSERGFFMLFEALFGFNALPYRLFVFFTAALDILLIARLTLRLTGSRLAACAAPVLWISNAALDAALCWTSVYNELLCPLFLLSALLLFIRWLDTGRAIWWWLQLVVFILGFGALEINIVYPALAFVVALVLPKGGTGFQPVRTQIMLSEAHPRFVRSLAPLFAISALYFLIHRAAAPMPSSGMYVLHFDARIFSTLALYWKWTVMPENWRAVGLGKHSTAAGIALVSLAVACAVASGMRAKRREVLFGIAWFLITLAPLLPLSDHRAYYYLTIPAIGIAITAAQGLALAFRSSLFWRAAAAMTVVVYLACMIPMCRISANWWYKRDLPIRAVVLGVAQGHENHPSKMIVLDGVTEVVYEDAIAHDAFFPLGVDHVYLTPESRLTLHPTDDPQKFDQSVINRPQLGRALLDDSVVIYFVGSDHLRNITSAYRQRLFSQSPEIAPLAKGAALLNAPAYGNESGGSCSESNAGCALPTGLAPSVRNGVGIVYLFTQKACPRRSIRAILIRI